MIRVIHTVLALMYIGLHFLFSLITAFLPALLFKIFRLHGWADAVFRANGKLMAWGIIRSLGGRVRVFGRERFPEEENRLCIISNHQSYLDIPLLVGYLPIWPGFIAKVEVRKVPVVNMWMSSMKCVYIKRGNPRSSIEMILEGAKRIKEGHPLVIFPEGTRSKSRNIMPFKAGSTKLATRSRGVIIPVTVLNTYRLWEEDHLAHPADICLMIHDPIDTSKLTEEEEKQLPARVEAVINEGARQLEAMGY